VLPPGALIDPEILNREIEALRLDRDRLVVSHLATVITEDDKRAERDSGLVTKIGSTGSGTGAALIRRIGRQNARGLLAGEHPVLRHYAGDTNRKLKCTQ
jgi:adenylosuccinate synthase